MWTFSFSGVGPMVPVLPSVLALPTLAYGHTRQRRVSVCHLLPLSLGPRCRRGLCCLPASLFVFVLSSVFPSSPPVLAFLLCPSKASSPLTENQPGSSSLLRPVTAVQRPQTTPPSSPSPSSALCSRPLAEFSTGGHRLFCSSRSKEKEGHGKQKRTIPSSLSSQCPLSSKSDSSSKSLSRSSFSSDHRPLVSTRLCFSCCLKLPSSSLASSRLSNSSSGFLLGASFLSTRCYQNNREDLGSSLHRKKPHIPLSSFPSSSLSCSPPPPFGGLLSPASWLY